jgi:hypothetical protein
MIRPDLLVVWPVGIDFPVFRWNIQRFRHMFEKVIICFSYGDHDEDYEDFVRKSFSGWEITFLQTPKIESGQDWRDVAVNTCLAVSKAEYIWFTEQDFLYKDQKFLEKLFNIEDDTVIHALIEGRLHPACIVVSRRMIEQTSKEFGIKPGMSDHFGWFTEQLKDKAKFKGLEELGFHEKQDYIHLAGLTHNYTLCLLGRYNDVYKPQEFSIYNYYAGRLLVEQDSRFLTRSKIVDEGLRNLDQLYPFFKP